MNDSEIWKDVPGFENFYEISNYGNVNSKDRVVVCSNGRKLHRKSHRMRIFYPGDPNGSTRPRVELNRDNNFTTIYIPNMVGHVFNGWEYESSVYYKDNNPHNNYVGNLTQDYHEAGWYNDGKIWKSVVGYEGIYEISSDGCLRTLPGYRPHSRLGHQVRDVKMHEFRDDSTMRYISIGLYKDGKYKECLIHRLVAEAFIPNPEGKPHVNHKDGNTKNNNVENLEWVSPLENFKHAADTGLNSLSGMGTVIQCVETGKIYPSFLAIERELNVSRDNVKHSILTKQKHKGYSFRLADEYLGSLSFMQNGKKVIQYIKK